MYDYVLLSATISETIQELESAVGSFMPSNSAHEGYALLLQQVDELKEEVWKSPKNRNPEAMRHEAIQVAATALRFLVDCTDQDEGKHDALTTEQVQNSH